MTTDFEVAVATVDTEEKVDNRISKAKHFLIGKSNDSEEQTKNRYAADYLNWCVIHQNSNADLIDELTADLIDHYQCMYPKTCDNQDGETEANGKSSYVYLAYD